MSLLSSKQIHKLIDDGVIDGLHENVNSSSLDIRIGNKILIEAPEVIEAVTTTGMTLYKDTIRLAPIDMDNKKSPEFKEVEIPEEGLIIHPGDFFLAHTIETFNLPNNISCEFKLRSSVARCGLQHMLAGWCDAGWHGAQLTMEFKNELKYHRLLLKPNMRIGQIVFFEHEPVDDEDSYAVKGNYNCQKGATKAFTGIGHTTELI
ncbi:dCTP deaminase [Proteus phage J3S]